MFGRYRKLEHRCIVMEHRASWLEDMLQGMPPTPPNEYFGTRDCAALNAQVDRAWRESMELWKRVGGPCLKAAFDRYLAKKAGE